MSGIARGRRGRPDPERSLRRKQSIWWCVASTVTCIGLLCALSAWGWRLPAGFGASTACVVAACGAPFLIGQGVGAVRRLARLALEAGLVMPASVGLMAALGVSGLVITLMVIAAHPRLWLLARIISARDAGDLGASPSTPPWDDLSSPVWHPETPEQLQGLADDELCLAWRRSFVALNTAPSASERLRVVEQRQRYLDELQRRSPDAFASWLVSGARAPSNPLPHLRAHPPTR